MGNCDRISAQTTQADSEQHLCTFLKRQKRRLMSPKRHVARKKKKSCTGKKMLRQTQLQPHTGMTRALFEQVKGS